MDDFQCFSSGIVEMRNIIGVINHHATHEDEALAVMVQRHPILSAILSNGMTSPNNNRAVRLPRNIPLRKVSSWYSIHFGLTRSNLTFKVDRVWNNIFLFFSVVTPERLTPKQHNVPHIVGKFASVSRMSLAPPRQILDGESAEVFVTDVTVISHFVCVSEIFASFSFADHKTNDTCKISTSRTV